MPDDGVVDRWLRHPLTALTGVLAVVYGVGFAFGLQGRTDGLWVWGAALLGALVLASLVAAVTRR